MLNGQLKPAYNIQIASSGGFVVDVIAIQHANDLHALRPFLRQMEVKYPRKLKNIVADAGYESIENYAYLKDCSLDSFVKPANYEIRKTRKFRTDIGRRENMEYDGGQDTYLCKMEYCSGVRRTSLRSTLPVMRIRSGTMPVLNAENVPIAGSVSRPGQRSSPRKSV